MTVANTTTTTTTIVDIIVRIGIIFIITFNILFIDRICIYISRIIIIITYID